MFFIGPISATEADPKWASNATKASIRERSKGSDGPKLSIGWMDSNQTGKRLIGCTWGKDARKGWLTQWPRAETMGVPQTAQQLGCVIVPPEADSAGKLRGGFESMARQGGDINEAI